MTSTAVSIAQQSLDRCLQGFHKLDNCTEGYECRDLSAFFFNELSGELFSQLDSVLVTESGYLVVFNIDNQLKYCVQPLNDENPLPEVSE